MHVLCYDQLFVMTEILATTIAIAIAIYMCIVRLSITFLVS